MDNTTESTNKKKLNIRRLAIVAGTAIAFGGPAFVIFGLPSVWLGLVGAVIVGGLSGAIASVFTSPVPEPGTGSMNAPQGGASLASNGALGPQFNKDDNGLATGILMHQATGYTPNLVAAGLSNALPSPSSNSSFGMN